MAVIASAFNGIDTANDFFRGNANSSDERHVGELFDCVRNLAMKGVVLVRHDHKRKEFDSEVHSNELIRGSAEWKEDPEVILHIVRKDKRTHEVEFEVGKLRYGRKPDPFRLWFDAGCFRLTPLPPVIAILEKGEKSRAELVWEARFRFGVSERKTADMIQEAGVWLKERTEGHNKVYEINRELLREAPWARYLTHAAR